MQFSSLQQAGEGQTMYLLRWGQEGTWVEKERLEMSIFDLDLEAACLESQCNTRKEKDKRTKR